MNSGTSISRVDRLQNDPVTLYAISTAEDAMLAAGLSKEVVDERRRKYALTGVDSARAGIIVGTGIGGAQTFLDNHAHQVLARPTQQLRLATSTTDVHVKSVVDDVLGHWPHPQ